MKCFLLISNCWTLSEGLECYLKPNVNPSVLFFSYRNVFAVSHRPDCVGDLVSPFTFAVISAGICWFDQQGTVSVKPFVNALPLWLVIICNIN